MNAKTPPETESIDAAELGAMMREMRENLGHELETVASDLRIRLVYLEAIEAGRLSDLPGNAYVSGFLRSYSDFLGLEGDEIVRRFKMAGAEISSQPQLHLPSLVEEDRLPTGSILLVAAVIAAAAYGGWYYLSSAGQGSIETVAKLPKELSGLVDGAKNQTAAKQVIPPSNASNTVSETAAAVTAPETAPATSPSPPVVSTPDAAPPAEPDTAATQETPAPVAPQVAVAVVTPETPASVTPPATPEPAPRADTSVTEPVVVASEPAPAATPEAVQTATVPPETDASSSSDAMDDTTVQTADGVRIVVRATADSYVAVRTGENEPLFSQLMRPGDSYEVPSGADLVLETGNAGGLQITIGGKRAPALGPIGEIRRNIPLDAEKLLRGLN